MWLSNDSGFHLTHEYIYFYTLILSKTFAIEFHHPTQKGEK
ncbi:hypothetical protein D1BOALGB6SA_10897 [Olavius sp. associated proteobacterium Delta 1]|nr:hypothetical protein D1BOALGB6SA_10897 [Olavius sp. associated proteobacterium Delta 1]